MQPALISTAEGISSTCSRVVRPAEVREKLGVGSSTLYAMVAAGRFPKPFVIFPGGRAVGWREHEVDAWLNSRDGAARRDS